MCIGIPYSNIESCTVFLKNIDGVEKSVIGLREQILGTDAIGASQVLPVTLDNEKRVKLDVDSITE